MQEAPNPELSGKKGFPRDMATWPRWQVRQREGIRTRVEVDVSGGMFKDLKGKESVIHSWGDLAISGVLDCSSV